MLRDSGIGFKIKILDALSVVNVRRVRLPPSSLPKIFILKPISNEVGCGIVPENRLARTFRDVAGLVNQKVAACANRVVWMVAEIPVTIKQTVFPTSIDFHILYFTRPEGGGSIVIRRRPITL
jgi:hypothetical protein